MTAMLIPISHTRTPMIKEVKWLAQGPTVLKWQSRLFGLLRPHSTHCKGETAALPTWPLSSARSTIEVALQGDPPLPACPQLLLVSGSRPKQPSLQPPHGQLWLPESATPGKSTRGRQQDFPLHRGPQPCQVLQQPGSGTWASCVPIA